jgi:hypothetical protein
LVHYQHDLRGKVRHTSLASLRESFFGRGRGLASGGPIAAGSTRVLHGYFIIRNYHSPAAPDADRTLLALANLSYPGLASDDGRFFATDLSGPGITQNGGTPSSVITPLSETARVGPQPDSQRPRVASPVRASATPPTARPLGS